MDLNPLESYRLIDGSNVPLTRVDAPGRSFLGDLALRLLQGEPYAELLAQVLAPGSPAVGAGVPDDETLRSPVSLVARDIALRAGLADGSVDPASLGGGAPRSPIRTAASDRGLDPRVTVGEAMRILGITRQGVINAIRSGRIRAEQHGHLWILDRSDVLRFRIAREEAGRKRNVKLTAVEVSRSPR